VSAQQIGTPLLFDQLMHVNGNGAHLLSAPSDASSRGRDYIMEITPRRRLEDIILSAASRRAIVAGHAPLARDNALCCCPNQSKSRSDSTQAIR
jgi:hypothetical protein